MCVVAWCLTLPFRLHRLCCSGPRVSAGTSSENRATCHHPSTASRKQRPGRDVSVSSRGPFILSSPVPGDPYGPKLGQRLRHLQGPRSADQWVHRVACVQHSEWTQDPTSCHRAGWHGVSYNKNCLGLCGYMWVWLPHLSTACTQCGEFSSIFKSTFWILSFSTMFLWFLNTRFFSRAFVLFLCSAWKSTGVRMYILFNNTM